MNTNPVTLARAVVRQHGHLDRDALSHSEKERLDLAKIGNTGNVTWAEENVAWVITAR